jgi:hypothetical protein
MVPLPPLTKNGQMKKYISILVVRKKILRLINSTNIVGYKNIIEQVIII